MTRDTYRGVVLGLIAGLLLAALLVVTVRAATPRSAQNIGAPLSGVATSSPAGSGQTGAPTPLNPGPSPVWAGVGDGTPSPTNASPEAAGSSGSQPTAKPSAATKHRQPASGALRGVASFVDPSYGARYLALPVALGGRGRLVRICAEGRCIVRRSTDTGPVPSLHRVADLSFADFGFLCGCDPWGPGLFVVTVEGI